MSVDYSSVMIYGYKITAEEVKRFKEEHGKDEFCCVIDALDSLEDFAIIRENDYTEESDYYFGVTFGSELHLDSIDAIGWHMYETASIDEAFEKEFGSMSYADTHCPMMYHFVRVW